MKNYHSFVIAIFLCTNALILHSQNTTQAFEMDYFKQTEFILGWQWNHLAPAVERVFIEI